MPAIMILGFDLEIGRVMLVGLLGGLLGILMMIPLRRALIVAQHGQLKYPEGTACAQVLKAGADGESRAASSRRQPSRTAPLAAAGIKASTIFTGFGIGLAYKTLMAAFRAVEGRARRRSSARRSRAAQSPPRSPRNCWAWATSSARASVPS